MAVSNATLAAQVQALTRRVDDLAAKVKSDEAALRPLISAGSSQGTFLAAINSMTTPGTYPLATDPFAGAGPNWQTDERDYVIAPADQLNLIVQKLQRSNLMV